MENEVGEPEESVKVADTVFSAGQQQCVEAAAGPGVVLQYLFRHLTSRISLMLQDQVFF